MPRQKLKLEGMSCRRSSCRSEMIKPTFRSALLFDAGDENSDEKLASYQERRVRETTNPKMFNNKSQHEFLASFGGRKGK